MEEDVDEHKHHHEKYKDKHKKELKKLKAEIEDLEKKLVYFFILFIFLGRL